jgi:endosialidase-like protein
MKMKTKTPFLINSISRSPLRLGFLLIALPLAVGGFALSPTAQALDPAPDGGYPNNNTAEGDQALNSLTTGFDNTANGNQALFSNTSGSDNTANGSAALFENTSGSNNTANGVGALFGNKTGSLNTANGFDALAINANGGSNTANGFEALFENTSGSNNTANGVSALSNNKTGSLNTANGASALLNNTTGKHNIALGDSAGANLTTGDNNIDIGNAGVLAEANTIRVGTVGTHTDTFIAGIYKETVAKGLDVVVDSNGHLGTKGSSERFKDAIKPMAKASEAILALKPVTFRYKHELDPEGIPQFGLVAEEVAKVNPDLVVPDANGKVYTVRYDAVNAMLLNEFLKEHRKVAEQDRKLNEQGATIAKQQKQIEALTTGLQKVSAEVEANKPASQVVVNNQ